MKKFWQKLSLWRLELQPKDLESHEKINFDSVESLRVQFVMGDCQSIVIKELW
jgi:hypothetical protein